MQREANNMKLEQLRQIVAIEKYESVSKAARKLYIRQPALSTSLNSLEKEIGIQIFERTPKGVLPTDDGKKILESAHSILNEVDNILQYSNQKEPKNLTGTMRICISPIYSYLYFDIVTGYKERFPRVDVQFSIQPFIRMRELLHKGEYNLAIDYVPQTVLKEENWPVHTLKPHAVKLLVGPLSRFYGQEQVPLAELRNERFLIFSEEYWMDINRNLKVKKEPLFIEDNASILQIIRKSDMIGIMADMYDKLDVEEYEGRLKSIHIVDIPEKKLAFEGHIIYAGNRKLTLLEQQSIQFLKELLQTKE